MDLQSWGHGPTKFLVCTALWLLFVLESTRGNGMCTRYDHQPKTRAVFKTHTESYILNNWRCRLRSPYQTKHRSSCISQRIVRVLTVESYTMTKHVSFCCPGFKMNNDSLICDPVCDSPCWNGVCVAPDVCECNNGFAKRNGTDNICEPVCNEPCENGYCSQPELCSCYAGYQLDPTHQYTCKPVCTIPCVDGLCSSPDVCTCLSGYKKTPEDTQKCQAHCSTPCHNAVCTEPEECTCFDGYKKDKDNTNTCIPKCENECVNAICTGPDFCKCFDGFKLLDNYYRCEPVCTEECCNAVCSAPEQCTCFTGYEMDIKNKSMCTPVCSKECFNANCTAPNICECSFGFEQTDDPSVCKAFCSKGCKNAFCTEPEVCTCRWGYEDDGSSSGCPTEIEKHECWFVNELIEYSYNKSCFFVFSQLQTNELKNCKVLLELLAKQNKIIDDDDELSLKCDATTYFTVNEHSLDLGIVCEVVLEKRTLSSMVTPPKTKTTTGQTQYFETDEAEYPTIDQSIPRSKHYTSEKPTSLDYTAEIFHTFMSPTTKSKTERKEDFHKKSTQSEFNIAYKKSTGNISIINSQNIPLNLNITLQFLPLITQREIPQSYFDQNSLNSDQEWCVCKKQRPWKVCVNTPIVMYFCPCTANDLDEQFTGESTALRATMKRLVLCALVALLVS